MRDLIVIHLRALVFWDGRLGRLSYLALQILLAVLSLGLTAFVSSSTDVTPVSLDPISTVLLCPVSFLPPLTGNPTGVILSFPLAWFSLAIAAKRTRDLEWPEWTALLILLPFSHLVIASLYCVVPGWRAWELHEPPRPLVRGLLAQLIPRSDFGAAMFAILFSGLLGYLGTIFSAHLFAEYGWSLFVMLPLVNGMFVSIVYGFHAPKRFQQCFGVAFASSIVGLFMLISCQIEGLVCIVMATPLLVPMVLLGSVLGYYVQLRPFHPVRKQRVLMSIFLWPLLVAGEHGGTGEPPLIEARTSILINAPVDRVWQHVVSFSDLPEPTELLFRTGIAYPVRATIEGTGVGAVRYCQFTTGSFVEPIEVWEPSRLLRFSVTKNPPAMKELNPFGEVRAPHLEGFLVSRRGEFRLIPLPAGRTMLIGTTWYQHRIEPQFYWRLWSNEVIHAIHNRVLAHVKDLSENRIEGATSP